jgi:hypothetical protein
MDRSVSRLVDRPAGTGASASPADVEALAWLLDNSIPIPGTGRRIGLDALVGLVPGLGDMLSGGLGLVVVLRGAQLGVPGIVLARMLANVAIDFVIGSVPLIGDAFDLWFKANMRNVRLIRRHAVAPGASTAGAWAFFGVLLGVVVLLAVGAVWVLWSILSAIFG